MFEQTQQFVEVAAALWQAPLVHWGAVVMSAAIWLVDWRERCAEH